MFILDKLGSSEPLIDSHTLFVHLLFFSGDEKKDGKKWRRAVTLLKKFVAIPGYAGNQ